MQRIQRSAGVLLHPTALPGPAGIGTLGAEALTFLRRLSDAGQQWWQMCPLVPTGYADSPYQGLSQRAMNPNLIDLVGLVDLGLLPSADAVHRAFSGFPQDTVDFGAVLPLRARFLRQAWEAFQAGRGPSELRSELASFQEQEEQWLGDFAEFMAAKDSQDLRPWTEWQEDLRLRHPESLRRLRQEQSERIAYSVFLQFLVRRQWDALRDAAAQLQIGIIGDLPIFVALDSADCWARSELFQLDAQRRPISVAGVPPDYFSETGQLWGNPLYDWERMAADDFAWWVDVIRGRMATCDLLRIDHFRGFAGYWSIPAGAATAIDGEWKPAPGHELFATVAREVPEARIIAEDLGIITPDVVELIRSTGFPGMKVLQFSFDSEDSGNDLPHFWQNNSVVYTGTHDNDTVTGWYRAASSGDRRMVQRYMNADGTDIHWDFIRTAHASVCDLCVVPMQDLLGLGSEARFNLPGTVGPHNWTWRLSAQPPDTVLEQLRDITDIYDRVARPTAGQEQQ